MEGREVGTKTGAGMDVEGLRRPRGFLGEVPGRPHRGLKSGEESPGTSGVLDREEVTDSSHR